MKILFIRPIITERPDYVEENIIKIFSNPSLDVFARHLKYGPESIENEFDLAFSTPFVIEEAIKAEKEGFDGIVVYCFANPGVDACREAVRIPVLGSGEASMLLASSSGRRIGIVTILPNIVPLIRKQCMDYIVTGKLVSVRNANIPVIDIGNDSDIIFGKLFEEAKACIEEDGADTIVLGCTGFAGLAKKICDALEKQGYHVPVIDPAASSLKMIEALVTCNVMNSKISYMDPIKKRYELPPRKK